MTVLFWIFMAYLAIKCVGLVIKPFLPDEPDAYYEPPVVNRTINKTEVHINVQDSFNYHSSDSYYKGGDHHAISQTKKESTDDNPYYEGTSYYDIFNDAIQNNRRRG